MIDIIHSATFVAVQFTTVKDLGYDHLADELWGAVGVFDAVQDSAEGDGVFTAPEADEETGLFLDDLFNDVLKKILDADKKEV